MISKKNQNINITINSNNKRSTRPPNKNDNGIKSSIPVVISNQQPAPQYPNFNSFGSYPPRYPDFSAQPIRLQPDHIDNTSSSHPNALQEDTIPIPVAYVYPEDNTTHKSFSNRPLYDIPTPPVPPQLRNELNTNPAYNNTSQNRNLINDVNAIQHNTQENVNELKRDYVEKYNQLQTAESHINKILTDPKIDDAVKMEAQIEARNIIIDENDVLDEIRNLPEVNDQPSLIDESSKIVAQSLNAENQYKIWNHDHTDEELARINQAKYDRDPHYMLTVKQRQELKKQQSKDAKDSRQKVHDINKALNDPHNTNLTGSAHDLKYAKANAIFKTLEQLDPVGRKMAKTHFGNIDEKLKNNQKLNDEEVDFINQLMGSKLRTSSKVSTYGPIYSELKTFMGKYDVLNDPFMVPTSLKPSSTYEV